VQVTEAAACRSSDAADSVAERVDELLEMATVRLGHPVKLRLLREEVPRGVLEVLVSTSHSELVYWRVQEGPEASLVALAHLLTIHRPRPLDGAADGLTSPAPSEPPNEVSDQPRYLSELLPDLHEAEASWGPLY
jgi:hypothetical protein